MNAFPRCVVHCVRCGCRSSCSCRRRLFCLRIVLVVAPVRSVPSTKVGAWSNGYSSSLVLVPESVFPASAHVALLVSARLSGLLVLLTPPSVLPSLQSISMSLDSKSNLPSPSSRSTRGSVKSPSCPAVGESPPWSLLFFETHGSGVGTNPVIILFLSRTGRVAKCCLCNRLGVVVIPTFARRGVGLSSPCPGAKPHCVRSGVSEARSLRPPPNPSSARRHIDVSNFTFFPGDPPAARTHAATPGASNAITLSANSSVMFSFVTCPLWNEQKRYEQRPNTNAQQMNGRF